MNSLDRLQQTIERLTRLMESEQSKHGGASAPPDGPSSPAFPRAGQFSRPESEPTYQRTTAHYLNRARQDKEPDDKWGDTTALLEEGGNLEVPLIGPIMAKTARVMKMIRFFGELHDHFSRLNWAGKQSAVDASNEAEGLKVLGDEKPIKLADKPPPADVSPIPFKEVDEAPPLPLADADPDKFFVRPPAADATAGGKKTHLAPHRLPNSARKTELAQIGGPPNEIPEAPPDSGAPNAAVPDAPYSIEAPPPLPQKTKVAHHTQLDDHGLVDPDLHAGGPDPLDSLPKAGRSRANLTEHAPLPDDYDKSGAQPPPAPADGGAAPHIPPALGEAGAGVPSVAGGTERAESRVEELLEETNKKLDNIVSVSEKAAEASKSVLGEGQGKPPLGPQSVPQAQPRIKEKTALDQADVLAAAAKAAEVAAI